MHYDRNLLTCPSIASRLCHPFVEIAGLDTLYFEMEVLERLTHNIGALTAAAELLAATRIVSMEAKKLCEFTFADCTFVTGIDSHPLILQCSKTIPTNMPKQ